MHALGGSVRFICLSCPKMANLRRASVLARVRDLWQRLQQFFDLSSASREVVDTILSGSANKVPSAHAGFSPLS